MTKLEFDGERCVRVWAGEESWEPSAVISSLALRNTVGIADPHPKPEVLAAAKGLRYRDFLTVAVVLNGDDIFPDNWIYIHVPEVKVGRIQNFRSWSPWMVPDPSKACVGLEYFCFQGDELWEMDDDKLVKLGMRELEKLGLARSDQLEFGFVERVPKAYPMYDADYSDRVHAIRSWLDGLDNFVQVGRNGLHRYNNSDHSMLTAMRAVDNLVKGTDHDIWAVNAESAYHEEGEQEEQQPVHRGARHGRDEGAAAPLAGAALGLLPGARRRLPPRDLERPARGGPRQRGRHGRGDPVRCCAAGAGGAPHRRCVGRGAAVRGGLGRVARGLPRPARTGVSGRGGERRLSGVARHGARADPGVWGTLPQRGRVGAGRGRRDRGLGGRVHGGGWTRNSRYPRETVQPPGRDLLFGLAIALTIAAYTLVDAEGVDHAQAPAYLFLLLAPSSAVYAGALAFGGRGEQMRAELRPRAFLTGACIVGAYGSVLAALRLADAAPVAAVRESSVVIAALLAAVFLHERVDARRLSGALCVVAGVAAIAYS